MASSVDFSTTALADTACDSAAPAPAQPDASQPLQKKFELLPGTIIKHYELIRKLGAGGMGLVFLARDNRLGRLVAIKFLLDHVGTAAERFLAEARTTAQCRHDNIVVIYDVDEVFGSPYMVLEYIEGRTLRAAMNEAAQDPVSMAVELMIPVARALACAHAMGIIHRDLKPENILLSNVGQVKVLDFGIAKRVTVESTTPPVPHPAPLQISTLTEDGALVGTMPYMSPEQWLGEPLDARTDIWAAGIILFELATGTHPLEPLSTDELVGISQLDVPMPSARDKLVAPSAKGYLATSQALAEVIDSCLRKHKNERMGSAQELVEALERLSAEKRNTTALSEDESPFAGLAAFQETDAGRFFGRDDDIAAVLARLRHQQLVAIAGASGAGKSSFVRAGILPALKRASRNLETFVLRPGRRPLAALADILGHFEDGADEKGNPTALVETLRVQPGYLGATLRARCRKIGNDHRIVLFVDQLEELYTQGIDAAERAAFCACLEGVADDASSPLRVIVTIRADFLDRVTEDRRFLSAMTRGLLLLPPMTSEGLQHALEKPLEAARYHFEDERLVADMLEGLAGTKSPLPLLQFTATKLWEARDREKKLLTREAYDALGGVAGALSTHADAILLGMGPAEQRLARSIFMRLVTPEKTRAVVQWDELCVMADDASVVEQVVQHLAEARLLLIGAGGEREGRFVELTHESLIERWGKLRQWLDENEKDAQFLAELRSAATQWEKNGKADDFLWRDRAAIDAGQWLTQRRTEVGPEGALGLGGREIGYLEAVVRLAEGTRRRRRQLIGGTIVFLSLVAFVVSGLAIQARDQAKRADIKAAEAEKNAEDAKKNADEAQKKTAEARNATRMVAAREQLTDPTMVLAILRELEPTVSLPPRWSELARWATQNDTVPVVLTHPDNIWYAAWSHDSKHIVSVALNSAWVWNANGLGKPVLLEGHKSQVDSAEFSPDGRFVVTASRDKTIRIWNADGSGKPLVLEGHKSPAVFASFSPDGKHIVSGSWDKTVRVWNADGSGKPLILEGHTNSVNCAAFGPDGQRIASASWDGTIRIWNANGSGKPIILEGQGGVVYTVAWSPDGQRIVTSHLDKIARIWNADGSGEATRLVGHEENVRSAVFTPDGRRIITASHDGTVRVWNADGSGTPKVFRVHSTAVKHAAMSPDGTRILSASWDHTVRIWNPDSSTRPIRLEGHESNIKSIAWSYDGRQLVTAARDKTARVWNADGLGKPVVLEGHEDILYSAAFSPDGRRVVTASQDKTARVWNADGSGTPLRLEGHENTVQSAAFSPDGTRILTASFDKTARVWNADGSGTPLILEGHQDSVNFAAWSPDGKRIVTISKDKTARVWNADGSGKPLVFAGHEEPLISAAWSANNQRIITTSLDKTTRIWNVENADKPFIVFKESANPIVASTPGSGFDLAGQRFVTLVDDQNLLIRNADGSGEPAILQMPDIEGSSVALSPDGRRIATVTHLKPDPTAKKWATIWTTFESLQSPNALELWRATRYCPPVDVRMNLLGVSKQDAEEQFARCEARVAEAFGDPPSPP